MDVTSIIVAQKSARIIEKKLDKLREDAAKRQRRFTDALEQGVGDEYLLPYKAAIQKVERQIKEVSDELAVERAAIFAALAPDTGVLVEAPVFKPEMYTKTTPRDDEDDDAGDRIPAIHASQLPVPTSPAYMPVSPVSAPVTAAVEVALPDAAERQVPPSDSPPVAAVQVEPMPITEHRRSRTLRQMVDDAILYAGGMAAKFAFEGMRQIGALADGDDALLTNVQRVFCCLLCS